MNKKAIAILGAIFLLIVIALGLLIFLRSRKSNTNNNNQNTNTPVVIPDNSSNTNTNSNTQTAGVTQAQKLTDADVVAPALYFNGQGISYFNSQGQLFTTDLQTSGNQVVLSNKRELTIPLKANISNVYWAPTGQNFIAEFDNKIGRA